MKKRILSLLLIALLLAPQLVSCASDTTEAETTVSAGIEETETETAYQYGDALPEDLDFGARNFRVATYNGGNLTHEGGWYNYIEVAETTGDIVNDAAFQRNLEVEERLNITISCLEVADWNNVLKVLKNTITAGEDAYEIALECSQGIYTDLISSNMLYDAAALPYIDFSKPYYTKDALDTFGIDGHQYLFSGAYTYPLYSGVYWLFNKELWEDYSLPDPYEIVREGKWTIDTAHSFVTNAYVDVNGDGKQDIGDQYGFSSSVEILQYLYLGMGMNGVLFENNSFSYDYETERAVDVLGKMFAWIETPEAYFNSTDQWGNFFAGNSLMLLYGSSLPKLRDLEFDFGFLPMPKLDETQENYKSYMCGGMVCVPITISDDAFVGASIEALFSASERHLVPAYLNKFVDHKILRDEGSVEMYRLLLDTASYDLTRYISPNANVQNLRLIQTLLKKKSTDIASEWAKVEQKVKADFDAFYSAYTDSLKG